jgi:hypothetical protein
VWPDQYQNHPNGCGFGLTGPALPLRLPGKARSAVAFYLTSPGGPLRAVLARLRAAVGQKGLVVWGRQKIFWKTPLRVNMGTKKRPAAQSATDPFLVSQSVRVAHVLLVNLCLVTVHPGVHL